MGTITKGERRTDARPVTEGRTVPESVAVDFVLMLAQELQGCNHRECTLKTLDTLTRNAHANEAYEYMPTLNAAREYAETTPAIDDAAH